MGFTAKIEEVIKTEKLYYDVRCDGCNSLLRKICPRHDGEGEGWECLQADDALILNLEGGYGMVIDPVDASEDELKTIFCGECTRKLCNQWPAISKIVERNCSSSLGHKCSKERKFVWKSLTDCCYIYCSNCGRSGSPYGLEDPEDIYSRRIVNCLTGCKNIRPGIWHWEVENFVWRITQWSATDEVTLIVGEYSSKEEAEKMLAKLATIETIDSCDMQVTQAVVV